MNESSIKLTVYFEGPFWVGVFEKVTGQGYSACRVVFGTSEPKNHEVMQLLARYHLLSFSAPIPSAEAPIRPTISPKRLQRKIAAQLCRPGVSTRSQEAVQKQREANKLERKSLSRAAKEAMETQKYTSRQIKRKEKKRGH